MGAAVSPVQGTRKAADASWVTHLALGAELAPSSCLQLCDKGTVDRSVAKWEWRRGDGLGHRCRACGSDVTVATWVEGCSEHRFQEVPC